MNKEECNKVLHGFMFPNEEIVIEKDFEGKNCVGYWDYSCELYGLVEANYTRSLDALVPVWEKLNMASLNVLKDHDNRYSFIFAPRRDSGEIPVKSNKKTIQEAAAMATAKAILELRNAE